MRKTTGLCTILIVSVCGVALAAGNASGQLYRPMKPNSPPPAQNSMTRPKPHSMMQTHSMPRMAPRPLTPQQRAAILANTLRMPVPPDLSAPFTLTPGRPIIPGMAELGYGLVVGFEPGMLSDSTNQGYAEFCEENYCAPNSDYTGPGFWLEFNALQGKHYAFDCRITGDNTIYYQYMGSGGPQGGGTVYASGDGHFVFATSAMSTNGEMDVDVTFYSLNSQDPAPVFTGRLYLWGCDVSSY